MSNLNNLPPFYVGQKVVCVDDTNQCNDTVESCQGYVVEGQKLTVKDFSRAGGVRFYEVFGGYHYGDGEEAGYEPKRFRPLEEQKFPLISMTKVLEEVEVCSN